MKTFPLAILLLSLISLVDVPAKKLDAGTARRNSNCSMTYWRPDSRVNVYFVRDMFSEEQKQATLEALGSWDKTRASGLAVTFTYAGETDGLIDCQSCLTMAGRDAYTYDSKVRSSFNPLRRNERDQLISAWIEIDRAPRNSAGLKGVILEVLRCSRN